MEKTCNVFGNLPLYRKAIFKAIDHSFDCDWYIDNAPSAVKTFGDEELKRVYRLPSIHVGPFIWLKGQIGLLYKDYNVYLLTGETGSVSLFIMCLIKKYFFSKKRIYLWTHGLYGKEGKLEKFFWKLPLLKMADGLFLYGNYSKELLIKEGFNTNKLFVLHNSLDYDVQLRIRNDLKPSKIFQEHFKNDNHVLIFIGRLTPVKRLDMLIEAVSRLKRRGQSYNVVFVGTGVEYTRLKELVNHYDLDKYIWFFGESYDEQTNAELVFNADLCVAPGNIGLTAMHSLMFGCPALSHDDFALQMPEFEAILPGVTGAFYKHGCIDSLVETISGWFNNPKYNRDIVRNACYNEIDNFWNPHYQMQVIKSNLK